MRKRKMYLDKQGVPWELIQRYHTSDYTYYVIENVLTNDQTTVTDWGLEKHFFEVPCVIR
jgi:hypothetical protein